MRAILTNIRNNVKIELIAHKKLTAVIGCQLFAWNLANDSNFDRNRVRGCNFGSEGGAFLILGGCSSLPKEEERLPEIMR